MPSWTDARAADKKSSVSLRVAHLRQVESVTRDGVLKVGTDVNKISNGLEYNLPTTREAEIDWDTHPGSDSKLFATAPDTEVAGPLKTETAEKYGKSPNYITSEERQANLRANVEAHAKDTYDVDMDLDEVSFVTKERGNTSGRLNVNQPLSTGIDVCKVPSSGREAIELKDTYLAEDMQRRNQLQQIVSSP